MNRESLKGKKLLILAGASVHCKVVRAAKELGVYTIVTDYIEDSPAKKLADESWMLNIVDVDGIVERCKQEGVDGVLAFCIDPAQIPYQQICERLGFYCFGNAEQYRSLTDKHAFIEMCQKCGVDVIPQYTCEDVENDRAEYPVFIKPVDSRGSRGQSVCYSKEETKKAIEKASKESSNSGVVIEKYMGDYNDFSVTYTIKNGEAFLTRTGDRYLGKKEDNLDKQAVAGISPSKYTDMYLRNVDPNVRNMIKSLGIKNGAVFMQGFIDGETVRFYDPGLRYPGTDYECLLRDVTGLDVMKMMISFALTGDCGDFGNLNDAYKLGSNISVQLYIAARAGKIAVYEGLEEISKNPNIVTVSARSAVGEVILPSGDVRQRVAEVVILAPDKKQAKELVGYVYNTFKVLDENRENMIVSKFNTDNL